MAYIYHTFLLKDNRGQGLENRGGSGRKKTKKKEGTAGIFSFEETALLPF
jgi:hypothetical protein